MKRFSVMLVSVSAIMLAGCLATTPPVLNEQGQPIKYIEPILGKARMGDARYVLIEKSIESGKYVLVDISKNRLAITNERQERIVFNKDLTAFATDFTDGEFQTYADEGNYGIETVIVRCRSYPKKIVEYSPCNSSFADVFVPMGVTKAYVAGAISTQMNKEWNNPAINNRRYSRSPLYALKEAGVFSHMSELANPKD